MQTSSLLPGICPALQLDGTPQRPLTAAFQVSVQPDPRGLADTCAPAIGIATAPSSKVPSRSNRLRVMSGAFRWNEGPVSVARCLISIGPGHSPRLE
jgi:hypothetical protein